MSNALVELHCHILPGIDDGAKDLDMSMSLIRKELQDGAAGIVFTPHFHYERISVEQFTARRKAAFQQVAAACKAALVRGVMIFSVFVSVPSRSRTMISYGPAIFFSVCIYNSSMRRMRSILLCKIRLPDLLSHF